MRRSPPSALTAKQAAAREAEQQRLASFTPLTRCPACAFQVPVRELARHLVERCAGDVADEPPQAA